MSFEEKHPVVIFADDQPEWHRSIHEVKEEELAALTNHLKDCEIVSLYDRDNLFEEIDEQLGRTDVSHIIVFLDLNFKSVDDGLLALNQLTRNKDSRIRQIPVFVYSISHAPGDVAAVYARNGAGFYHKLDHPDAFWSALQAIDRSNKDAFILPQPVAYPGDSPTVTTDLEDDQLLP